MRTAIHRLLDGRRPSDGDGWRPRRLWGRIAGVAGLLLALLPAARCQAVDAVADAGSVAVVATVGTTPIFQAELDAVLARIEAAQPVAAVSADGAGHLANDRRSHLAAAALETLIDERLLRSEIDRKGITVSAGEIDERLQRLQKQVASRGMEWETFLRRAGRDERAIRDQIALEIGLDKMIRPQLTEASIAAEFARRRREVDGTRLRVSHIVLRPDISRGDAAVAEQIARADTIRREILQGAMPFADAARRYSAGPSRSRGGDLGWITRGGPFVEDFTKQAFAIAKGDISRPFVTAFGIHIVQVTEAEPGRAGLDVARPKMELLVAAQLLRDTVARLRKATPVEYAEGIPHFDPAAPAEGGQPRKVIVGGAVPPG